jgi:hypothetical protein
MTQENTANTPASPSSITNTAPQQPWEYKWRCTCSRIAYHSVNYVFSAIILALLFPLSKAFLAPLLSSFIPISHTSLPKALMVMTIMYWLPIHIDIIRRWIQNKF